MKQANWNGKDVLLVEVDPDIVYVESNLYIKETLQPAILAFTRDPNGLFKPGIPYPIPIPDGYNFAFADPLHPTEQEAGELVGWFYDTDGIKGYYNYPDKKTLWNKPTESLYSRIRSEWFQHPERVVMLIKK